MGASQFAQATVSVQRMLDFFLLEELNPYVLQEACGEEVISMSNASLSWSLEEENEVTAMSLSCCDRICCKAIKTESKVGKQVELVSTKDYDGASREEEEELNRALQTIVGASFSIKRGQLVAVVGGVGSGKSSLLSGLLGDLNLLEGG